LLQNNQKKKETNMNATHSFRKCFSSSSVCEKQRAIAVKVVDGGGGEMCGKDMSGRVSKEHHHSRDEESRPEPGARRVDSLKLGEHTPSIILNPLASVKQVKCARVCVGVDCCCRMPNAFIADECVETAGAMIPPACRLDHLDEKMKLLPETNTKAVVPALFRRNLDHIQQIGTCIGIYGQAGVRRTQRAATYIVARSRMGTAHS